MFSLIFECFFVCFKSLFLSATDCGSSSVFLVGGSWFSRSAETTKQHKVQHDGFGLLANKQTDKQTQTNKTEHHNNQQNKTKQNSTRTKHTNLFTLFLEHGVVNQINIQQQV